MLSAVAVATKRAVVARRVATEQRAASSAAVRDNTY